MVKDDMGPEHSSNGLSSEIVFVKKDCQTFIKSLDTEDLWRISNSSLTDEQISIIIAALSGVDIKVNAFAGTGKTTVIKAIAAATSLFKPDGDTVYLAFNKFIAEDIGRKNNDSLRVCTIHQFARNSLIALDEKFRIKLRSPQISYEKSTPGLVLSLSSNAGFDNFFLEIIIGTINNFAKSIDEIVNPIHVPHNKVKSWVVSSFPRSDYRIDESKIHASIDSGLIDTIVEASQALWLLIIDKENDLPLTFDYFLKLWSLNSYHAKAKLLMIDEAQDLDPVMLHGINNMDCQKIWVGDKNQQIYRWRGAINAMQNLECDSLDLTETFRFDSIIAGYANSVLHALGNKKFIVANKPCGLSNGSGSTAILCRTNLSVLLNCIKLSQKGKTIHIVSKAKDALSMTLEMCCEITQLRQGVVFKARHILGFLNYDQFIEGLDDCSQEIKQAYRILENYSHNYSEVERLIKLCLDKSAEDQEDADYIICTAHLSKGREWDFIIIDEDFESFVLNSDESTLADELRLFYVAITRCKCSIINNDFVERVLSSMASAIKSGGMKKLI